MVTVKIYKSSTKIDRYHLLPLDVDFSETDVQYTENGAAFNGFDNPLILDTDYDSIIDCRIMGITGIDAYGNREIFFLIENVIPRTNGKVALTYTYDAWMNNRENFTFGYQNDLYETSTFLAKYPYYDIVGKYKKIKIDALFQDLVSQPYRMHLIMLYHNSSNNLDYVYYFKIENISYYQELFWGDDNVFSKLQLVPESILGLWVSPLVIDVTNWIDDGQIKLDNRIRSYHIELFNLYSGYYQGALLNPFRITKTIHNDDLIQDCVLDTNGGIAWISTSKDRGNREFIGYLTVTYNSCYWDFYVKKSGDGNYERINPNTKFAINCISVGFMADYFQTYQNIYKNYNSELRKAQLDKQIVDSIGNVVSSTVNMGVMSGLGGSATPGAIGGFAGSTIQNALAIWSQDDFNKKLEKIESAQAKIQFDTQISSGDSLTGILSTFGLPCFAVISPDDETVNSYILKIFDADPEPIKIRKIVYKCGIESDDLMNLIESKPFYLCGDFDFMGVSAMDALQLKERFKHGVNFIGGL